MDVFVIVVFALLFVRELLNSRVPWLHPHYQTSSLLRTTPTPALRQTTSRFAVIGLTQLPVSFSPGKDGALQLRYISVATMLSLKPRQCVFPVSVIFSEIPIAFTYDTEAQPLG